jgi:Lar family restriction alleviation protein
MIWYLKKCPFCGGEAELYPVEMRDGSEMWAVSCANEEDPVRALTNLFDTELEAVTAWNRRAGE